MMKWKHQKTDFSGDSDVESSLAVLDRVLSEFDDIETDSVFGGDSETPSSADMEEESRASRRSSLAEVPLTARLARAPAPAAVAAQTASASSAAPPPVDRSTKPRPGSAGGTPVASWRSTKSGVDHSTVRSSASQPARAETEAKSGADGVKRLSSRVNGLVRSFETTMDGREAPQQPAAAAAVVSRAASSCAQKSRAAAEARPRRAQSETRFGDSVGARAAAASAPRLVRQIGPPPSTRPPPPPPPPSSQTVLSSAASERSPAVRSPGETGAALASRGRRLSSTAEPVATSTGELPPLPTKAMLRQKSSPHINYLPPGDPRRRSLPAKDLLTGESASLLDQTHIESKIKRLSLNFEPSGPIRFPSRLSRDIKVDLPSQRTALERHRDVRGFVPTTEARDIDSPSSTARLDETVNHGDAEPASDSTTNDLPNSSLRTRMKRPVTSSVSVPLMMQQPDLESFTVTNGEITTMSETPLSLKKTDIHDQTTFVSTTHTTRGAAESGANRGEVGDAPVTGELEEEQRPSLPAKQHSARSRDERRPPARRKRDRKRELGDNPPPPEEAQKQISLLLNRSQLAETPTSTLNGSVSTLGSSASTLGADTDGRARHLRPTYLESRLRPSRPAPSPPIQRQTSAPALASSGSLRSRHSDASASGGHRASQSFRAAPPGDSLRSANVSERRQGDPERSGSGERAAEVAESRSEMGEVMFDVEDSGEMTFSYVYNHGSTSGGVDAVGPMSLPPSLGIDESPVQPNNSFPKKMPLFSPIVKDRLNDNTNMYIPAPPSPRPDYCDSELSETDSLTRDGSDNESLFALKDKKADRKETGPRFMPTKISPPMHRKNKVKESKERHNKSKQKDRTPEKEANDADTKRENKGKKDKKQASPPRVIPLTSASSAKTQAQLSRKISSQSRAPAGKSGDQKSVHPPKQVSTAKLLLSQKAASPLKKQSSSSKLSKQQSAAPSSPQRSARAEAVVSPKQRLSSAPTDCSPASSAAEAAASASSPTPAAVGVSPSPSKEPTSSASKRKSPPKQTSKSSQQTPPSKQRQSAKSAPPAEQVKSPQPPPSPQQAADPPVTPSRLSAAAQEPEPGTSSSPAQSEVSPSQPGGESLDAAAPPAKTPLQVMIEDFHKNLPPPPTFDDALNVSMDGPVSLAEEVEMEPDDSYYSDDSLDYNQTGESKKRSTRRRRRKSDWSTTTSFDYVHRKEARKKIPEKLTHRDEGISSLESHNSASDDNDVARKGNRASGKHLSALEAVGDLAKLEGKLGIPGVSAENGKSKSKFDSIRKLLKEGRLEGLGTPPPDFVPPPPPVVRSKAGRRVEELTPATGKETESSSARMRLRNGERPARPRSHSQPTSSLLESASGRQRSSESPADVRISRSFLHQSSKSSLFVDYRRPGGGSPSSAGGKGSADGAAAGGVAVSSGGRRRPAPRPDPALRLRPDRPQQRSESPLRRNRPVRPPEGVQVNPLTHARPGVPPSPLAAGFHSAESLHCSLPPVLRASGGKGPSRGHLTLPGERMSEKRDIRRADSLTVHKKEKEGDSKFKFSIFKGFWRRKQYSLEQV